MGRIFITLYAGVIGAILLFSFSLDYLYGEREQIETRRILQGYTALSGMIYELEGEEAWRKALAKAAEINLMIIEPVIAEAHLNTEELKVLEQRGAVFRTKEGSMLNEYFFYEEIPNAIVRVQYDPNQSYWQGSEMAMYVVRFGFLIVIAVVIALWIWGFHYQLSKIRIAAQQLSEGKLDTRAPEGFFQEVGRLNKGFNRMAERLEQLVSSHKRLTNAVAHELRTPIFRLRCQLELLTPDMPEKELDEFVVSMDEDLVEIDSLVDELLSYARMESGRQTLNLQTIEVGAWLKEAQSLLAKNCQHPLHFFEGNGVFGDRRDGIEGRSVTVLADTDLLHRAMSNLVRNADVYTQTKIQLSFERIGNNLMLYVDDDGIGIPEADRDRIFEPFERMDRSRNRNSGGYGLGLSICREIATLHKGRIDISESPLGGARIIISLPI